MAFYLIGDNILNIYTISTFIELIKKIRGGFMIYIILLIMIILNLIVFVFGSNIFFTIVIISIVIGALRGVYSKTFIDIFNLKPYIFKLKTKENFVEFIISILFGIFVNQKDIISKDISTFITYVCIFSFIIYRFLLYDFSKIVMKKM